MPCKPATTPDLRNRRGIAAPYLLTRLRGASRRGGHSLLGTGSKLLRSLAVAAALGVGGGTTALAGDCHCQRSPQHGGCSTCGSAWEGYQGPHHGEAGQAPSSGGIGGFFGGLWNRLTGRPGCDELPHCDELPPAEMTWPSGGVRPGPPSDSDVDPFRDDDRNRLPVPPASGSPSDGAPEQRESVGVPSWPAPQPNARPQLRPHGAQAHRPSGGEVQPAAFAPVHIATHR